MRERSGGVVDDIDQGRDGEWFEEIGTGACTQFFRLARITCHEDDRDLLPISFESDLPVRSIWQHAIEQHKIDAVAKQMIDRFSYIGRANNIVAVTQYIGDESSERYLILHHQNAPRSGHGQRPPVIDIFSQFGNANHASA
jgi:hypothetical protein